MNKKAIHLSFILLITNSLFSATSHAEGASGAEVYNKWCMGCHAPSPLAPGTSQLKRSKGEAFADIKKREDLPSEYIKILVRKGYGGMPSFRRTEISEGELQRLLEYLEPAQKVIIH